MISNKRQDYLSIVFRNLSFAFFAPFGTVLFQWIVFKKDIFSGHFYFSIVVLSLGTLFLILGYIILRERNKT